MSEWSDMVRVLTEHAQAAEEAVAQLAETIRGLGEYRQTHPSPVADDYPRPPAS